MDSHYTQISSNYDYFYEHTHKGLVPIIINKLQLTPDDLLLDIGAATGKLAQLLWKRVGLKNPVTCVEPCKAFFEIASTLDGIVPVLATSEQFYEHLKNELIERKKKSFTKVLIIGAAHHFDNLTKRLGEIIDNLPKNGICLLLHPPYAELSLPFSRLHLQHIATNPCIHDVILPYAKDRNDVISEVTTEESTFEIPKSRWYNMIRGRFWSHFHRYTDEELEESIKELDNERFPGVKDDECITIVEKYGATQLTKK